MLSARQGSLHERYSRARARHVIEAYDGGDEIADSTGLRCVAGVCFADQHFTKRRTEYIERAAT